MLDVHVDDVVEVMVGQRARLADRLADLEPRDWSAPSRCALWDVADVVAHLTDTPRWVVEMATAPPTQARPPFDPEVTPHEFVLTHRGRERADLLDDLATGTERLGAVLRERAEPLLWLGMAHYPPALAAAHLLWDSWLHARDILLPLGLDCAADPDELEVAAGYGLLLASLGGHEAPVAVDLQGADTMPLRFDIRPDAGLAVVRVDEECAQAHVRGDAAAVVDALAGRAVLSEVLTGRDEAVAALGRMSAAWRSGAGST